MGNWRGEIATEGERKTVLVVDDDRDYLEMLNSALSSKYEVIQASSGESGLRTARASLPDVAVVDIMMPGMSGIEMIRLLQADEHTRDIPVVVVTSYYLDHAMGEFLRLEHNVRDYLQKGVGVHALLRRLSGLWPNGGPNLCHDSV